MNKKLINERKKELITEYALENRAIAVGKKLSSICIFTVLILRCALSVFQTVFFSLEYPGLHIWIPLTVLPLLLILKFIYEGGKGFAYITLIDSVIFMVIHFSLIYHTASDTLIKEIYTNIFIFIMTVQFASSMLILFNQRCDAYFTAKQRINIKIHGENMLKNRH